jgi:hypothetical protein
MVITTTAYNQERHSQKTRSTKARVATLLVFRFVLRHSSRVASTLVLRPNDLTRNSLSLRRSVTGFTTQFVWCVVVLTVRFTSSTKQVRCYQKTHQIRWKALRVSTPSVQKLKREFESTCKRIRNVFAFPLFNGADLNTESISLHSSYGITLTRLVPRLVEARHSSREKIVVERVLLRVGSAHVGSFRCVDYYLFALCYKGGNTHGEASFCLCWLR